MTQKIINIGTNPDDGTGDPLRTAFSKTNSNFAELYGRKGFYSTQAGMLGDGTKLLQNQVFVVLGDGANDGIYVASKNAPAVVGDFAFTPFAKKTPIQFKGPTGLPTEDPNDGPDGTIQGEHMLTAKAVWVWDVPRDAWLKQFDLDAGTPILATKYMSPADLPTGNPNDKAGLKGNYLLTDRSVWQYNTVNNNWDKKYDIARTPPTIYMGPAALPTGNPNDITGLVGQDKEYLVTEKEAWYYDVATAQWIKDFNLVAPPRIPTIYKGPVELPTGDPNDKTGLAGNANGDHLVTNKSVWSWNGTTNSWDKDFDFDKPRVPMTVVKDNNARNLLPNLQTNDLVFVTDTAKFYEYNSTPRVTTKVAADFKEVSGGLKTVTNIAARDGLVGTRAGDLVFVMSDSQIYEVTLGGWQAIGGSNWPQFVTIDPTTFTVTAGKVNDWFITKNSVWNWDGAAWRKAFVLEDDRIPKFVPPALVPTGDPNGVITGDINNQAMVTNDAAWRWDGTSWNKIFDFSKTPPLLFRNPPGGDPNTITGLTAIANTPLLTERAAWHYNGISWVKDFDLNIDHPYVIVQGIAERDALPAPKEGTLAQVLNTVDSATAAKLPGFYSYINGVWTSLYPSPSDLTKIRTLKYDPQLANFIWEDTRNDLEVALDYTQMSGIPGSQLTAGKLVYCRSDRKLYEFMATAATKTNTMADWRALGSGGIVQYANRYRNLPNIHTVPQPEDGAIYVIRSDFEGKPYYRMVVWDASIQGAPEQTQITPLAFQATDRLTDFTSLGAPATSGRWYVIEAPAGYTPVAGEPYAGIHLPLGTKLIDCGDPRIGRGGWMVAPPDTGYTVGGTPAVPAAPTVDDLTQPRITGGWHFIDRESWVNPTVNMPDHPLDNRKGDFQTTTEAGHKVIKVYDGTSWQTLFDEEQVKGWIASLALFRGTISEDPTQHIGTITWSDLPDLTALSATQDKGEVGRYWIWAGQDPFNTVSGTSEIGSDLAGAVLHVGDWLVVADRGNSIPGDPLEVDLHWVRVGGDLLTKTRGTGLFGLKNWVAGTYEQDSLVVANGNIYRARSPVVVADVPPGTATGIIAPTTPVMPNIAIIPGVAIADQTDLERLCITAPAPAQWAGYDITADIDVAGAPGGFFEGEPMFNQEHMVWTGFPTLTFNDTANRVNVVNGWLHDPAVITSSGAPEVQISQAMVDEILKVAVIDKWDKVPLTGGVKFLSDDTGLPSIGNIGDSYLILTSAVYGSGNPAIVTWDAGVAGFVQVGGGSTGGGTPMNFIGADPLVGVGVPIGSVIMWAASNTPPAGWLLCDGSNFDQAVYPDLFAAFGHNRLPDLVGQFVRGGPPDWAKKAWTTGNPKTALVTDSGGVHRHTIRTFKWDDGLGHDGSSANRLAPAQVVESYATNKHEDKPEYMYTDGNHRHTVTGGGDAETAPDHAVLAYIIKAAEKTAHLRTP